MRWCVQNSLNAATRRAHSRAHKEYKAGCLKRTQRGAQAAPNGVHTEHAMGCIEERHTG